MIPDKGYWAPTQVGVRELDAVWQIQHKNKPFGSELFLCTEIGDFTPDVVLLQNLPKDYEKDDSFVGIIGVEDGIYSLSAFVEGKFLTIDRYYQVNEFGREQAQVLGTELAKSLGANLLDISPLSRDESVDAFDFSQKKLKLNKVSAAEIVAALTLSLIAVAALVFFVL